MPGPEIATTSATLTLIQSNHLSQSQGNDNFPTGRIFDASIYPAHFAPADIESKVGPWNLVASPSSLSKCPCCLQYESQNGRLVIAIAGACINHGKDSPSSRSAIGVYFGPDNQYNIGASLGKTQHTTQIAELRACITALQTAITIWKTTNPVAEHSPCHPMRLVVIKTESPYLVNGATEWLPKWKENGWKGCKGQKVANDELWRVIDLWIRHLESEVTVQFWRVSKKENQVADGMAHSAMGTA
ncbi:hypothetical protein N7512_004196 [Penicillium capsulatum]|nr:hypothetical protein N7512_004196 [Penicillium capsulatum]